MILHCLDRQTKARKYDAKDVTPTTSKGVFEVNKTNGSKHVINFGCEASSPSCTCKDWVRWHIPCKHFFAVFNYVPEWGWSSLPQSYLESAYLSMDTGAINLYFQQEDNTSDSLNNGPRSGLEGDGNCNTDFDAPENPPSKKKVISYVCVCLVLVACI